MHEKGPLGLPRGSVRDILALIFVAGYFTLLFLGKNPDTQFFAFFGIVIGYYFGNRTNNGGGKNGQ